MRSPEGKEMKEDKTDEGFVHFLNTLGLYWLSLSCVCSDIDLQIFWPFKVNEV